MNVFTEVMLVINLVIICEKVIIYINLTINFCMYVCACECVCVRACVYASAIVLAVRIWCMRESESEHSQRQRRSIEPQEETDRLFYLSRQLAWIYPLQ